MTSFFPNELAVAPQRLTLESYFEPDAAIDLSPPAAAPWLVYTDPVAVGLVSETEASFLFRQYMERVAPYAHIFDPHLHTYDRVRGSAPLFAAVMAIAARYFHPDLAEVTLDIAETNIGRALRRDDVDMSLVQALLVLVLWKRPADRTAYYKMGLVSRLLAQLRVTWDTDRTFSSIEEERAHVDVERTMSLRPSLPVMVLTAAIELSYSILLRLPSHGIPVPEHTEMLRWAQRHAHLGVPGDMFKAYLAEMWQFHFSKRGDLWFRSADEWAQRQEALAAVLDKWRESGLLPREYRGHAELLGLSGNLSRRFMGLKLHFGLAAPVLDTAEVFAHGLKNEVLNGNLHFWPEYSLSGMVLPGVLVYHARDHLSPSELVRARHMVGELRAVLDDLPERATREHALAGVQRTYRRLHEALENWTGSQQGEDPMHDLDAFLAQIGFMFGDEAMGMLFHPEELTMPMAPA